MEENARCLRILLNDKMYIRYTIDVLGRMDNHMKKLMKVTSAALVATAFVTTSLLPSAVFAANSENVHPLAVTENSIPLQSNMEKAIHAALTGPEMKKLNVMGHEFNVKPASITKKDNITNVFGQLSHHLSYRPDDQLFYRIVIENGEVKNVDIKIDRGGWTSLSAPFLATLAKQNDIPVTLDTLQSLGQKLGSYMDGKWEPAAEAIISSIALYVK